MTYYCCNQEQEEGPTDKGFHSQGGDTKKFICKYFRKGCCKHGMRGRNCPDEHPKICDKYITHGSRKDRGCTQGNKCMLFHPEMCFNSLRKGECFPTTCAFNHIKGKKLHPPVTTNKVGNITTNEDRSVKGAEVSHQKELGETQPDAGHFLEIVRLLKAEIL